MARAYTDLPVFKTCYDVLLQSVFWCSKMQKDFRYSTGEDLKRRITDVIMAVYKANHMEGAAKVEQIVKAQDAMVEVKLLTRILYDVHQISTKQYAIGAERMVEIDKHLSNWKKSIKL